MITLEFPGRMQPSVQSRNKSKQSFYFDHARSLFSEDRGNDSLNERFLVAAKNGDLERIQNFLARASKHSSVNVDTKDKQTGNTAMIYAALNKDEKMVSLLLKYGADITLYNNEGHSVLDVAPEDLRPILLGSVQRKGASPRHLLQAAWQGNIEVLKQLLELDGAKFDVNCQNADGFTPLLLVTRDVQLFERIAKSVEEDGYKPLEVVEELLQCNADCRAGDTEGRSALHLLAPDKSHKAVNMTNLLIDKGDCHVDVPDNYRNSPLHFASREDNCPIVIALIKGGADVNIKGDSGRTPLHLAADRGHARVASILLGHGADVTLVDDYGYSPVDLAKGEKVKLTLREAWAGKAGNVASDVRCITETAGSTGSDVRCGTEKAGNTASDVRCVTEKTGNTASDVRCRTPDLSALPTAPRAITPEIVQVWSTSNQTALSPKKLNKRSTSAKVILGRNSSSARRPSTENAKRKTSSSSTNRTQSTTSSARLRKTGVCESSVVKLPTLSVLNVQFNYVKNSKHGTSYWLGSNAERAPRPPHGLTHQFSSPALLRRAFAFPPRTPADARGRSFSESTIPRPPAEESLTRSSLPSRVMPLPGRRITSPELRSSYHNPLSCVGAMIDLDALRKDIHGTGERPIPSLAFEKDDLPSPPPSSPIDTKVPEQEPFSSKSEELENTTQKDEPAPESVVLENHGNENVQATESNMDLYSTQTLSSLPRPTFWIPYGEQESDEKSGQIEDQKNQDQQRKASGGSTFFIDMKNLQGLISGPGEACVKAKSSSETPEITEPTAESPRSPSKGEKFWVPLSGKNVPQADVADSNEKEGETETGFKANTTDYRVSCKCDEVTGICSCTVVKVRTSSTSSSQENSAEGGLKDEKTPPVLDTSPHALPEEGSGGQSGGPTETDDKALAHESSLRTSLGESEGNAVLSTTAPFTKTEGANVLTKDKKGQLPRVCADCFNESSPPTESVGDSVDNAKSEAKVDVSGPDQEDILSEGCLPNVTRLSNSSSNCLRNEPLPSESSSDEKLDLPEDKEKLEACAPPSQDEKNGLQNSLPEHSSGQSLKHSTNFQEVTVPSDPSPSPPKQAWTTPRGEETESSVVIVNSFPSPELRRVDRPTIQSPIVPVATNRTTVSKGKKGKKGSKPKSGKGKSTDVKKLKNGKGSGKKKGKKAKAEDDEIRMIQVKQETPDERESLESDAKNELDVPAPPMLNSSKMLNSKLYRGRYLVLSPILESPRSVTSTPREEKAEIQEPSHDISAAGNAANSKSIDERFVDQPSCLVDEGGYDVVDGGFFSKLVGSCVPRLNLTATNSDSDAEETEPFIEQGKILEGKDSERTLLDLSVESNSGRKSVSQECSVDNSNFLEGSAKDNNISKKTSSAVSPVEDEADDYIESILSGMMDENNTHFQETNFSETTTGPNTAEKNATVVSHHKGGFADEKDEPLPGISFPEDQASFDVTGPPRTREESQMEIDRKECCARLDEEQGSYDSDDSDDESTGSYISDQDETGSEFSSTDDEFSIAPLSGASRSSVNSHFSLETQSTTSTFSDASMDIDFNRSPSEQTLSSDCSSSATLQSHTSEAFSNTSSSFSTSSEECLLRSRIGSSCRSQSVASQGEEIVWKKGNILGKGAFGQVWLGLTSTGEMIAVKQVELHSSDPKEAKEAEKQYEMLQEEVMLLKTLRHENVVRYIGTCLEGRVVNIFMEFVPGGSIASILSRFGTLSESVFQRYTKQLVSGVAYLHRNNVIHRDIKGGNIMIMPTGVLKLIDFGCAKRQYINLSLSRSNVLRSMKGSPYWMAPEVIMETGHGRKADIWSIGCTVFEMATGKPPWAEMPAMAAIFAIGSGSPVPRLGDEFSEEAREFVSRCMTRDPDERPSATQLKKHKFIAQ